MKNINVEMVLVSACPGAHLNNSIREALLLAVQEQRSVTLTHNETDYVILYSEIMEQIIKQGNI